MIAFVRNIKVTTITTTTSTFSDNEINIHSTDGQPEHRLFSDLKKPFGFGVTF